MTTTLAGAIIDKFTERLIGHQILWKLTAQMSETVYCTLVHAIRAENFNTPFDKMQSQGQTTYLVIFGDRCDDVGRDLFFYLRDKIESDMKRNDERQGSLILSEEESNRINNGDHVKGTKKRKITADKSIRVSQPDFNQ